MPARAEHRSTAPSAAPNDLPATPSSHTICPLHDADTCRSCPHLDLPLASQLQAKQSRAGSILSEFVPDGAWEPPFASAPQRFRNKAKMAVSGSAQAPVLGLADARGLSVDLRHCPLHVEAIERALPVLADFVAALRIAPYDIAARRGELKHILVTASPDDELLVRFVLRSQKHVPTLREALPHLQSLLPNLAVVSANIQPEHAAILEGEREIVLTQRDMLPMRLTLLTQGELAEALGDGVVLPLQLPTRSFFQTNTAVAAGLYAQARAWVQESQPQRVWDLYCGVGGFALALAGENRQVWGVEVSASAIEGAQQAAREMGLSEQQAHFMAGDATTLDAAAMTETTPDLLVVNPPRRGIGAELAATIERSGVRQVLYSSCNPASLARDLAALPSYRVTHARLFDMFPHTDHMECAVLLDAGT